MDAIETKSTPRPANAGKSFALPETFAVAPAGEFMSSRVKQRFPMLALSVL
jgi:hypothetical protein